MKLLVLPSLAGLAAVLSACAPMQLTKSDVDGRIVCDVDRMAEVERVARRENRQVHWINCPQATLRVAS